MAKLSVHKAIENGVAATKVKMEQLTAENKRLKAEKRKTIALLQKVSVMVRNGGYDEHTEYHQVWLKIEDLIETLSSK